MDIEGVIAQLKSEADKISRALAALTGAGSKRAGRKKKTTTPKGATSTKRKRGAISPAGRKRLSMLMKRRWAERKRKGSASL
jgi:hypothetical protein